ncbi:hypothetical protein LEN26_001548 [Aphanomyces euteiches]|nr:hypothetical protein AeMF1_000004 [Aphanomyces euteiches]KAH9161179.1 hypothetical protein LEN26_001548 [Aphanomyces euteiches]
MEAAVELHAEYHTIATPKGVVDTPNGQEHTATKKENMVSMVQLFRFADTLDVVLMTLGAFAAFATGAAIPLRICSLETSSQRSIQLRRLTTTSSAT